MVKKSTSRGGQDTYASNITIRSIKPEGVRKRGLVREPRIMKGVLNSKRSE